MRLGNLSPGQTNVFVTVGALLIAGYMAAVLSMIRALWRKSHPRRDALGFAIPGFNVSLAGGLAIFLALPLLYVSKWARDRYIKVDSFLLDYCIDVVAWTWPMIASVTIFQFIGSRKFRGREEALRKIASGLGLSFEADGSRSLKEYSDVQMILCPAGVYDSGFGKAAGVTISNLMQGRVDGSRVWLFDYQAVTGSAKYPQSWAFTVALLVAMRTLPRFQLRPAGAVNVEGNPAVGSNYYLWAPNDREARDAMPAGFLSFLDSAPDWHIESTGTRLVFALDWVAPSDIPDFLREAVKLAAFFNAP